MDERDDVRRVLLAVRFPSPRQRAVETAMPPPARLPACLRGRAPGQTLTGTRRDQHRETP